LEETYFRTFLPILATEAIFVKFWEKLSKISAGGFPDVVRIDLPTLTQKGGLPHPGGQGYHQETTGLGMYLKDPKDIMFCNGWRMGFGEQKTGQVWQPTIVIPSNLPQSNQNNAEITDHPHLVSYHHNTWHHPFSLIAYTPVSFLTDTIAVSGLSQ
jgi:hypothetical protein